MKSDMSTDDLAGLYTTSCNIIMLFTRSSPFILRTALAVLVEKYE
jgi:hypothetical protein